VASLVQLASHLGPALEEPASLDAPLDFHRDLRHAAICHRASVSKPPVIERTPHGAAFLVHCYLHRKYLHPLVVALSAPIREISG
jgi:hypothetical protein